MILPRQIVDAIVNHARFTFPEEACGLLAGGDGQIRMAYALTNRDASPRRYTVDPAEHYRALRHAERMGWELMGVFHSHPTSAAYPSETDVRLALEPSWLYLIVSLADSAHPSLRGFRIVAGTVTEVPLAVGAPAFRAATAT